LLIYVIPSGAKERGYVTSYRFRKFNYSKLKQVTKDFGEEIERGVGGTMYKGVLIDNCICIANQGENEFLSEVSIIGNFNYMTLIYMFGYIVHRESILLVYEYIENGSLA